MEMGEWVARHGMAIYATRGGPWKPSSLMVSTRAGSTINLFFLKEPSGPVTLAPLPFAVTSARTLDGKEVRTEVRKDALVIDVPGCAWDGIAAFVELKVAGDALSVEPLAAFAAPSMPGATATASAVFGNNPKYAPAMAIDGDETTRWATPAGTHQAWLRIDFPKETAFSGIGIEEECCGHSSRVKKWELQKFDVKTWTTVHAGSGIGAHFETAFDPVMARVIRINIIDATEGPTFSEVRFQCPTP